MDISVLNSLLSKMRFLKSYVRMALLDRFPMIVLVLCIFELKIALKQRLREIVVLRGCPYSYLFIVHAIRYSMYYWY